MPTPKIQTLIDRASNGARYCLNLRSLDDLVIMQGHLTPEDYQRVLAYWLYYCAASATIDKAEAIRLRIPRVPKWDVGDLVGADGHNAPVVAVFYRTGWRHHWEIWTPGYGRNALDVYGPSMHNPTYHYKRVESLNSWRHTHTTPPLAQLEQPLLAD